MAGFVFNWLKKKGRAGAASPLSGAPAVRRQKSYSAQSGYVYQYFYEGMRQVERGGERCTEYVFDVSADRRSSTPVSVFLPQSSVDAWGSGHGRELSAQERYAMAKMGLFQAFDERENPGLLREPVLLRPQDVEAIGETLEL